MTPPSMLEAIFLHLRLLGPQLLGLPLLEHFLPAPLAMLEATFLGHLLLHHLLLTPTAGTLHGSIFRLGMFRLGLLDPPLLGLQLLGHLLLEHFLSHRNCGFLCFTQPYFGALERCWCA